MNRQRRAIELIEQVLDRPVRATVSCSFQARGVALVHMLRRYEPDIPVLFVDTGYHFPETLRFRDELVEAWNLDLWVLRADISVADQRSRFGLLYATDPDRCCAARKVEPLYRILEGFDVWLTGLQRDRSSARALTSPIERKLLPGGHVIEKANPLFDWNWDHVMDYHGLHAIPLHPLYQEGYQSIGCAPCTLPLTGGDVRAGRWSGLEKTECGLHTQASDVS